MLSSQETSSLAIYGILFCDIQSLRGHFVNDSLQFAVTQLPDLTASYLMSQTQPCSASTAFKPKDVGDHSLADPFPAQPHPPGECETGIVFRQRLAGWLWHKLQGQLSTIVRQILANVYSVSELGTNPEPPMRYC